MQVNAQSSIRLQPLVNDTVAQFQLAYRHNVAEQRGRYEQLSQTVAAWRDAERNDTNNRLLADWLRRAIRSSMPGSQEPLPPIPQFERRPVQAVQPPTVVAPIVRSESEIVDRSPTEDADTAELDKAVGDPFLDDPESVEDARDEG